MRARLLHAAAALAVLAAVAPVRGQEGLPPEGVRAEAEGRWDAARAAYRAALEADPSRADVWLRLADVEAAAGRTGAAADATGEAAALRPADRALQERLSRALAMADRPAEALAAIERALAIGPPDEATHRARASLATWAGDYDAAEESYRWLESRGDVEATLGRARIASWRGRAAEAIEAYERYVARAPDDAEAPLELARQHAWSGSAARALEVLARYEERFGVTNGSRIERARALVTGGRPGEAVRTLDPVADDAPEAYEAHLVRALALAELESRQAALREVDALARLDPSDPRTEAVRRIVRAPIRSSVTTRVGYGSDSDDVERVAAALEIGIAVGPSATLDLELASVDLRSDGLGGLAPLEGGADRDRFEGSVGLTLRGRRSELSGRIGTARVGDGGPDPTTWSLAAALEPDDAVRFDAEVSRALHDVSPRAVSLGVERTRGRLGIGVFPALGWRVEMDGVYDDFSDGNRRLEGGATIRRALLRRSRVNVDVGVGSRWSGFAEDLDHGYYDPGSSWRHLLSLSSYWKLSEAHGLSIGGGIGAYRDDATSGYETSGEAFARATLGIHSDWMMVLETSWLKNTRLDSGAFSAAGTSVALTRRF